MPLVKSGGISFNVEDLRPSWLIAMHMKHQEVTRALMQMMWEYPVLEPRALREHSDLEVVPLPLTGAWKSAITMPGVLCVPTSGTEIMVPKLLADRWDYQVMVKYNTV